MFANIGLYSAFGAASPGRMSLLGINVVRPRVVDVRFSNRPVWVKRFQAFHHHYGVDVAHGLALLFGIGTKALPLWGSKTRWNNLYRGLAVGWTADPSGHANSPHPSSREGHHSTAGWSSSFLLLHLILHDCHAAAVSRVQLNSVPSTQMRCMITANRRASATIAFFISTMPGDLHCPGLEPGPIRRTHQHDLRRFVEHHPHHLVAAPRYPADAIDSRRIDAGKHVSPNTAPTDFD